MNIAKPHAEFVKESESAIRAKGKYPVLMEKRAIKFFLQLFIITALLWIGNGQPVSAQRSAAPFNAPPECLDNGQARKSQRADSEVLRFVGTEQGKPIAHPGRGGNSAKPEDAARDYLARCGAMFGLKDQTAELSLKTEKSDQKGRSTTKFQQVYRGIPVMGGELIMQLDSQKNINAVIGKILPDLAVDTQPAIAPETAKETALGYVAKIYDLSPTALSAGNPELWIYDAKLFGSDGAGVRLVWRMDVAPVELSPILQLVLVDAQTGSIPFSFNQMDTLKNRATYTAGNSTLLPGNLVCNESNPACSGGDADAVKAHLYAGQTYDFYFNYHGRDSIDNAGMTLISTVHYSQGYCNAFWNGRQMVYGDGCSIVVDDVVAHELTHGVTSRESNLFYYYQSGAINESLSDMWGEFLDLTNGSGNDAPAVRWLIGEDVSSGAIRDMKNPAAYGGPDKMTSSYYCVSGTCSTNDNGGVHTNSGINNKAVALMTDGGTFNGYTVSGIGITKVANIYYEAQTNLLTSSADYADLYEAVYQACINLIGEAGITLNDCTQVRNATLAVEMNRQPVANFNTDAPVCSTGLTPNNLFFDDLESGTNNWTSYASDANRWYLSTFYAHSGVTAFWESDTPARISDSYFANINGITLPPKAYLHFYHAYGFEDYSSSYYDGGVLEYSADGGVTWNDAGALADYNGYKGTIKSGYGNPLAGRSAFVADSHGYISTRLNLNSLAGQSVRFRWRMGLDSSDADMGWYVDDIRFYTCNALISGNAGVADAVIAYTGGSTTTDASGNYSISVPEGWTGTVTPSKAGYVFMPDRREYANVTADQTAQNYTAATASPAAFNKSTPANGAIVQAPSGILSWEASSGATGYQYCYDSTNDNSCSTWIDNGTSTSVNLGGLAAGSTYYWQVRAVSSGGETYANGSQTAFWSFSVNSAPTDLNLSAAVVNENLESGAFVGTFTAIDPDPGDTFTYSLMSTDGGDNALFTVSGDVLLTVGRFDFEAKSSYVIHVRVIDSTGLKFEKAFTITVVDVNEPPSLSLSNTVTSLAENANTTSPLKVADLVVMDDALGTNTFSLSGADASLFEVTGSALYIKANTALDYETKTSMNVAVEVDDNTVGATPDDIEALIVNITDVDENAPYVVSILRASPNPTNAASVNFTVTFSKPVTGVDTADFVLTTTGITGAAVKSVSGENSVRTVTVSTGIGSGTLRLDVKDNDTIVDAGFNPLGGAGMGNGSFVSGESYSKLYTYYSNAATDGFVLESTEFSNRADVKGSAGLLYVGDDLRNRQYRSILDFNTASLPDKAVITSATLRLKKSGIAGDPFATLGAFVADIKKGVFGTASLELTDFNAAAEPSGAVGTFTSGDGVIYQLTLEPLYLKYINLVGPTQFRLRYANDDDNDKKADYISLYAGDSANAADKPQLLLEYYVP